MIVVNVVPQDHLSWLTRDGLRLGFQDMQYFSNKSQLSTVRVVNMPKHVIFSARKSAAIGQHMAEASRRSTGL